MPLCYLFHDRLASREQEGLSFEPRLHLSTRTKENTGIVRQYLALISARVTFQMPQIPSALYTLTANDALVEDGRRSPTMYSSLCRLDPAAGCSTHLDMSLTRWPVEFTPQQRTSEVASTFQAKMIYSW
nr:hypothetical protein CFP56_57054 [Quercus suber]